MIHILPRKDYKIMSETPPFWSSQKVYVEDVIFTHLPHLPHLQKKKKNMGGEV